MPDMHNSPTPMIQFAAPTGHREARTVVGFDYALLAPELAARARDTAARIRDRTFDTTTSIGRDLIAIKGAMDHGTFGAWIKAEMHITLRSAEQYMSAARWVEGKNATGSHFPPTVIYALASPSAPTAVVDEVLAAAEAGNVMSPVRIKAKLADAIKAARHAAFEAHKLPVQIAKEQKAQKSKAKRDERRMAERLAEKDKDAREEQDRVDRLSPLVKRIATAIGQDDLATLNKVLSGTYRDHSTMTRLLAEMLAAKAEIVA